MIQYITMDISSIKTSIKTGKQIIKELKDRKDLSKDKLEELLKFFEKQPRKKGVIKELHKQLKKILKKEKNIKKSEIKEKNINEESINVFYNTNSRCKNDSCNKLREKIISMISNNNINDEWYKNKKWSKLRDEIKEYEKELSLNKYSKCEWITKGGRGNSIDFRLKYFNEGKIIDTHNIEFKYNVNKISDCPQWSSPMKPSQYLICKKTYEEYFYDNYLSKLCKEFGREMPDKEDYLKQIHSIVSTSLSDLQEKYYKGSSGSKSHYTGLDEDIKFYKLCKKVSKESFNNYFKICELDYEKLNKYLIEKQKNKEYMLYKNGKIYYEVHTQNDYTIDPKTIIKKSPNFQCKTISGKKLNILFRWKNGHGIAFPAFQIS